MLSFLKKQPFITSKQEAPKSGGKQYSVMKVKVETKGKNNKLQNMIECMSFVMLTQWRRSWLFQGASMEWLKYMWLYLRSVRWTSCWHYAFSCVWIVVVHWHCSVLLLGLNELYKQMSYQIAWLKWQQENAILTTSLFSHTFTYVSFNESISTPKYYSWHKLYGLTQFEGFM